ncbi:MAG TPA: LacI family transcriptional regulator, partial [Actinobacteria bacterium]|nr:LacI family transcriptional regulator [Actinomycetota bacterium]
MGKGAAELLADAMDEKGEVGWIFHDADFYVTNQRDNAFKAVIQANYPNMEIVAEQGFAETKDAEGIAAAMIIQNPDIGGFYVAWDTPA